MNIISRSHLLALWGMLAILIAPMVAHAYSNQDVKGCYALAAKGSALDASTQEWIPVSSTGRLCANGNGSYTWSWIYHKIGACAVLTLQTGGPSTYSVNRGGAGQGDIVYKVVNVQDLCAGMGPDPGITVGERVQIQFRFYLDKSGTSHFLVVNTLLPDNATSTILPGVATGHTWKQ